MKELMYELKRYVKVEAFKDYKIEVHLMHQATTKHILEVESKLDNSA